MAGKVKQADGYQVKQVLADKAAELNAFGWNKVKNSTRTVKKKTFVNVRRKIALARIPGLKPIENKYNKWAKKKIKKNPVGGIFAFLFMLVFFAVALVGLYIGLNDNLIGGKAYEKSIAAYNAAIETDLITADDLGVDEATACEYDADKKAVTVSDGYKAFVKKFVAYSFGGFINNYSYSVDGTTYKLKADEDQDKIDAFAKEYLSQLDQLGFVSYAEDADEEAIEKAKLAYDASVIYSADKDSYSVKAGLLGPVDGIIDGMIRPLLQGFGLDYKPLFMDFGIPFIAGAGCFVLFIICLIAFIRICGAKRRIEKRETIVADCVKEAHEMVYGVKVKNRDLMTKTERKMYDMQSMIVRAIHQASDDEDED